MPIVDYDKIQDARSGGARKFQSSLDAEDAERKEQEKEEGGEGEGDEDEEVVPVASTSVDYKHITRKTKAKEYLKEVEVRRSEALEREYQRKLAKEEAERLRAAGAKSRAGVTATADDDDDDCPPLM
jgi:hypothetical protein